MAVSAARYAALVGDGHRQTFGQFFTPPTVARFMMDWVLAAGAPSVHDPAFGLGAFRDAVEPPRDVRFSGSELDPEILGYYRAASGDPEAAIREEDYLQSWGRQFDAIVCNPPYMRFQRFRDRAAVRSGFRKKLGLRLSGYTNSASAFLVKSLAELRPGGRLAYVLPLEFLNTGYGTIVKERLTAPRRRLVFIRLGCEREVFPEATTSVGIILYDSGQPSNEVSFFSVTSLDELPEVLDSVPVATVPYADLRPDGKWLVHFQPRRIRVDRTRTGSLRQYGHFSRGIATGANGFFVLRASRVRELGLPPSEVTRCITRSVQVRSAVFTERALERLAHRDQPVFLFRPGPAVSPQAAAYVREGERQGLPDRFLLRHRTPWHRQEVRRPAPLLFGVFSRGAYKVVRNRTRALHLTCFHGFTPNLPAVRRLDRLFLYLASATGRRIVAAHAREYGDSLTKYEPHDLNEAAAPRPRVLDAISDREVAVAMAVLRADGAVPEDIEAHFRDLVL